MIEQLVRIVDAAVPRVRDLPRRRGSGSLRQLGLEPHELFAVLILLEDAFGIEWDFDVGAHTFDSFESVAAFIDRELAR